MLSTPPLPSGDGPGVGEGGRRAGWGKGDPGSPPLPAHAHTLVCTNRFPVFLFLFLPSQILPDSPFLSCCYFSSQALSLWVSFDLCSPSFPSSSPPSDICSFSDDAYLQSFPVPQHTWANTYFILIPFIFTTPFLHLDIFKYTNNCYNCL